MHFALSNREQKWCPVSEAQCVRFLTAKNECYLICSVLQKKN